MAISYSSLPPQLQQLLAEQFGVKTPEDAQRLAARLTENPAELVATLQQLGINLTPEQASAVAGEAADWMDQKAVNDLLSRAAGGRGVPSVRGGVAAARQRSDLDALITEMMSAGQQGGGTLPQQSNFKVPRPVMPHSKSTSASNDPRMQKMIADIYRTVANQSSGPERAYTPTGDRS